MEKSNLFEELRSELEQSGAIRVEGRRGKHLKETARVQNLRKEVEEKLPGTEMLQDITAPPGPLSPEWSLLKKTSYPLKTKRLNPSTICCTVIEETDPYILETREKFLQFKNAMDLRLSLWLDVNQWLKWNLSSSDQSDLFDYWDMVPDQIPTLSTLYFGDKAEKIRQLLHDDTKRLGDLGNYLTRCPALLNNPDSPTKDGVISSEVKKVIDTVLDVSGSVSETPETLRPKIFSPGGSSEDGRAKAPGVPTRRRRQRRGEPVREDGRIQVLTGHVQNVHGRRDQETSWKGGAPKRYR